MKRDTRLMKSLSEPAYDAKGFLLTAIVAVALSTLMFALLPLKPVFALPGEGPLGNDGGANLCTPRTAKVLTWQHTSVHHEEAEPVLVEKVAIVKPKNVKLGRMGVSPVYLAKDDTFTLFGQKPGWSSKVAKTTNLLPTRVPKETAKVNYGLTVELIFKDRDSYARFAGLETTYVTAKGWRYKSFDDYSVEFPANGKWCF